MGVGSMTKQTLDLASNHIGVLLAGLMISLWLGHLVLCFQIELENSFLLWYVGLILLQTFLHTGLFIISHDAMHVSVIPRNRRFNDWIGAVAAGLYGLFSYRKLQKCHQIHHRSPASAEDPDFCREGEHHLLLWYVHFMGRYMARSQGCLTLVGITVILHSMHIFLRVPYPNLILFWAIPMMLSSFQLFFFGTFLPHRISVEEAYPDHHRARSCSLPPWLSFLTCYHFGYHLEHHRYPHVPWYQLPQQRQLEVSRTQP